MNQEIIKYIEELCKTPSPTGYTKRAEKYLIDEFTKMGYEPYQTNKGNVIVPINPGEENRPTPISPRRYPRTYGKIYQVQW